jgi:hypothetical protein
MHVTQNRSQPLRGESQMHRQLAAIVLCVLAQGATAQCLATSATINTTIKNTSAAPAEIVAHPPVRTGAAVAQAEPSARAELIKAAAASTRDDAPPPARGATPAAAADDNGDHPRRGGTAMLLAALALMSGIALRRFGARDA